MLDVPAARLQGHSKRAQPWALPEMFFPWMKHRIQLRGQRKAILRIHEGPSQYCWSKLTFALVSPPMHPGKPHCSNHRLSRQTFIRRKIANRAGADGSWTWQQRQGPCPFVLLWKASCGGSCHQRRCQAPPLLSRRGVSVRGLGPSAQRGKGASTLRTLWSTP